MVDPVPGEGEFSAKSNGCERKTADPRAQGEVARSGPKFAIQKYLLQSLEISPERGITFTLPSVPDRRSYPVSTRIVSFVARAATVGSLKIW
jgi:hypothetical protein